MRKKRFSTVGSILPFCTLRGSACGLCLLYVQPFLILFSSFTVRFTYSQATVFLYLGPIGSEVKDRFQVLRWYDCSYEKFYEYLSMIVNAFAKTSAIV